MKKKPRSALQTDHVYCLNILPEKDRQAQSGERRSRRSRLSCEAQCEAKGDQQVDVGGDEEEEQGGGGNSGGDGRKEEGVYLGSVAEPA